MSRRVVIVGAGVEGLFSALYVRRAGFEVTVVEREGEVRETTSYGNAGLVVPSHFVPLAAPGAVGQALRWMFDPESPFYVRPTLEPELLSWGLRFWRASTAARARRAGPLLRDLHLASKAEYVGLAESMGNPFELRQSGVVMLCESEEGLEEEARLAARAVALGLPARVLGPREVGELEPGVQLDVVGGVHFPEDACLDPGRLMRALQAELQQSGVEFLFGRTVERLETRGRRVEGVRLAALGTAPASSPSSGSRDGVGGDAPAFEGDRIAADEVVLAAGVWTEGLARSLDLRLPMRAGKGYSMTLTSPPERPTTPALLSEAKVAVTPLPDGVRFGGTMEVTGLRSGVSESRVRGIVKSALRVFRSYGEADFASAPVWYGFRPCSPDGLPYLGRPAGFDNLVVATGHAMIGVSLGPVTGRLVAELLEGRAPSLPLEALSPDRYA